jgi:mono/diheme cytochrome c family protein
MKKTKVIVIASGIFVLCLSLFYHPTRMSAATPVASNQTSGKELFEKNCAKCHGEDGQAKTFRGKFTHARNLTTADFQSDTSDEQIADAIRTGPKAMPSFEKKLTADEINALVQYVRTLKK